MRSALHVVLTGASGGLGQAIAMALAGQCNAMLLVGRDMAKLRMLHGALKAQYPSLILAQVTGDLTDESTRQQVFDSARRFPGPLNLLINNAGINQFHEFESQSSDAIERLLIVNLLAPIQLTQALLPLLKSAPKAQIVNIGSIFGYLGYPGFAAYCAAKFGLRGFSQSLRRELADTSVAVRYFAPRTIRTSLTTPTIAAMNRELNNREDPPEIVARVLLKFLASDAWERKVGFPERLYVFLNQLFPMVSDKAVRKQLNAIKKHLPAAVRTTNLIAKD